MHEKVREFLESKKSEAILSEQKEKERKLISLGLYEKVYSPNGNYSKDYPCTEYSNAGDKYYKMEVYNVSNEEYEEILKYSNVTDIYQYKKENAIARILTIIAWVIFIGGFIAGIVLGRVEFEGYYRDYNEFSFSIAMVYWFVALVSGTILLGFAEIIELLHSINKK